MLKSLFVTQTSETRSTDVEGVGSLRWEGSKLYRWVQNSTGEALVVGALVCYDPANAGAYHEKVEKPATAYIYNLAGVAMSAMPSDEYGWILIFGQTDAVQVWATNVNYGVGHTMKAKNGVFYAIETSASLPAAALPGYIQLQEARDSTGPDTNVDLAGFVHCMNV